MNYEERKKEEEKKGKKQEFPEEEGKSCPECGTINELEAKFC